MILLEKIAVRPTETTIRISGRAWRMGESPQAKSPFARHQARAAHSSGMEKAIQALPIAGFDACAHVCMAKGDVLQSSTVSRLRQTQLRRGSSCFEEFPTTTPGAPCD
jgi:hypothetical protein